MWQGMTWYITLDHWITGQARQQDVSLCAKDLREKCMQKEDRKGERSL
jgi:hypothetical protein